jgi:hypothetical protein
MEDILTFVGYMLPACLVMAVVIGMVAWAARQTRKSMSRADELVQLSRDTKRLLEELVALQTETNRLLAARQDQPKP